MTEKERKYFERLSAKLENLILNQNCVASKGDDTMNKKSTVYKGYRITERTDGRRWARITKNGHTTCIYGRTDDEVKKKISEFLKYGVTNREPEPKWTLYSWLDFWRRTFKTPYNKTDMYQYHIKNHVKARFKDKPLKDVTTIDLQMIITACPYSRSRVDVYQMLNAAFRVAKQQDVISKNPAEGLISPRHRKVSGLPLTLAEQKAFFKSIENEECKNDYLFYLFSGVRRSELLTINVASLDYENNLIYVHGTKTENAERAIPFTDILKTIISEMTPDANGYFFTHSADWYTKNFKKYSQNHCLRELRKSFITRSGENGVDIKAIQRWVGHADYQTTANIYFKAQDEFLKSNAKKLNDYQTAYWRDVTEDDI